MPIKTKNRSQGVHLLFEDRVLNLLCCGGNASPSATALLVWLLAREESIARRFRVCVCVRVHRVWVIVCKNRERIQVEVVLCSYLPVLLQSRQYKRLNVCLTIWVLWERSSCVSEHEGIWLCHVTLSPLQHPSSHKWAISSCKCCLNLSLSGLIPQPSKNKWVRTFICNEK